MTTVERFWAKVDKTPGHGPKGDCWAWTGCREKKGYGHFYYQGRYVMANRMAIELTSGPLLEGENALHHCDYPPCVRPDHLFRGTQRENLRDCARKGRQNHRRGERSWNAVLDNETVVEIRFMAKSGRWLRSEIAEHFGLNWYTVNDVVQRRTWAHVSWRDVR